MKHLILAIGMTVALAYGARADNDSGLAAFDQGDLLTAFAEFTAGAEQGDAGAQYVLGTMYANGQGTPQDYGKAIEWYRRAADQRLAQAQYSLGASYKRGLGVAQDQAEAAYQFYLAAEQGHAEAQNHLGFMYLEGHGVSRDYQKAHMWFSFAALGGLEAAGENRDFLTGAMSAEDVAAAQRLAYSWLAERGGE